MSMPSPGFHANPVFPAFESLPTSGRILSGNVEGRGFRFSTDWVLLIMPAILVTLRVASPTTSALGYVVAAVWALFGQRQAVLALFFVWFFNNTTHTFCGPPLYAAFLRYAVLLAAAVSVIVRGPSPASSAKAGWLLWFTIPLFVLIGLHSIAFSRMTEISLLKFVTFALAFLTSLCGWAWMTRRDRTRCLQIIIGTLVLVMFASLAYWPTGRAYLRQTRLLTGVLVHSQILGVAAAMIAAFLGAQTLVARPFRWWRPVAMVASLVCLYVSGARAGMLGFVGGMFAAGCYEAIKAIVSSARGRPRVVRSRLLWAGAAAAIVLTVAGGTIYKRTVQFILKYDDAEAVTIEGLQRTAGARVMKVEDMRTNLRRHAIEGIGFGVPSDTDSFSNLVRDPILGLPVMATVEKGFMPLMMLEELGVPLGALSLVWLAAIGMACAKGGFVPLSVYGTAIVSNFGEATFFSQGGNGLLLIILVCWAATESAGGGTLKASLPSAGRTGPRVPQRSPWATATA